METSPNSSSSSLSRFALVACLVLLVGGGMYFVGRRSYAVAQNSPQGSGQTAQKTLDDAQASGSPTAANSPGSGSSGRHLAPRDTFYLLQYASAKTPTGVIGFEPGQEVHLVQVRQASRTLVVGDGEAQVEVGPEKLTNDLDIAALVRQKDQTNQAKVAAYIQQEQKAYEDSKREAAVKTEQELDKIDERKQAAAVAANNNAANRNSTSGTGVNAPTKLDEPPVTVGGTSGYGYGSVGSAYYGSPYSYFGGGTTTTGTAGTGTATAPANTGAAGGGGARGGGGSPNVGR